MKKVIATAAAALIAVSTLAPMAGAQDNPEAQGGMRLRREHMIKVLSAACSGKAADDPCSFTRLNGKEMSGTCETRHQKLLCVPTGHMHRHRMGMGVGGEGHMGDAPGDGAPPSAR